MVNGDVPRNLGTMPVVFHTYANLSRIFTLNPNDKDHPRALTVNVRAANLLNHTNATAISTIVSSPTFGQAISAEAARPGRTWLAANLLTVSLGVRTTSCDHMGEILHSDS